MNNWKYKKKKVESIDDFPANTLGFIYKITNHTNGKYYLGRKTAISTGRKKLTIKEKKLPENSRKKFKQVVRQSDWRKYWGSSKPLLEDIKKGDKCSREIIKYCFSKAEITYYETEAIMCSGALLDVKSYNAWVSAKIYKAHLLKNK